MVFAPAAPFAAAIVSGKLPGPVVLRLVTVKLAARAVDAIVTASNTLPIATRAPAILAEDSPRMSSPPEKLAGTFNLKRGQGDRVIFTLRSETNVTARF